MSRTAAVPATNFSRSDERTELPTSTAPLITYRRPRTDGPTTSTINREMAEREGKVIVEILDPSELALRLKVRESWVIEQSKRSRTADPIPVLRLGKHRRYRWGSPEMTDWLARRSGCTTTSRKTWS